MKTTSYINLLPLAFPLLATAYPSSYRLKRDESDATVDSVSALMLLHVPDD